MEIKQIEKEVANLPLDKYNEFRAWFQDFDYDKWDEQIENDIESGKFDKLAARALSEFNDNQAKEI